MDELLDLPFEDTALNNNLDALKKLNAQRNAACLILGSKNGKFTGELDDIAAYEWDGKNLQGFIFGATGSGKTVIADSLSNQFNLLYDKPVVAFDRKGEGNDARYPLASPPKKNLLAYGLQPMGYGARMINLAPAFTEAGKEFYPWGLDFADFYDLKPFAVAMDLLETAFGIDDSTKTSEDKYAAARETLENVLQEKPRTIKTAYARVQEVSEELSKGKRSDALLRKLKNALFLHKLGYGRRFNFKKALNEHRMVNIAIPLKAASDPFLQIYEAFVHYQIYLMSKAKEIPQTCVKSEEHDMVAAAGSQKNVLKEIFQSIALKERFVSNLYIKTTQSPALLNRHEVAQASFIITFKPKEKTAFEAIRWLNPSENLQKELQSMPEEPKNVHPKSCMLITYDDAQYFRPFPSFTQYHEEKPHTRLREPDSQENPLLDFNARYEDDLLG